VFQGDTNSAFFKHLLQFSSESDSPEPTDAQITQLRNDLLKDFDRLDISTDDARKLVRVLRVLSVGGVDELLLQQYGRRAEPNEFIRLYKAVLMSSNYLDFNMMMEEEGKRKVKRTKVGYL
jgi:hypothetical protein